MQGALPEHVVYQSGYAVAMSRQPYRQQFHKYSYSDETEGTRTSPSTDTLLKPPRQTRAGTDPGRRPGSNVGPNVSATPRYLPEPRVSLLTRTVLLLFPYKSDSEQTGGKSLSVPSSSSTTHAYKPDASLLSVPSVAGHRRNDSAQDLDGTTSFTEAMNNVTIRNAVPEDPKPASSSSTEAGHVADRPAETIVLNDLLAALHVRAPDTGDEAAPNDSSPEGQHNTLKARVNILLQALQQWTIRTGDTTVLRSLLQQISDRWSNPTFTKVHPYGRDSPALSANTDFSPGQSGSSKGWTPTATIQQGGSSAKGKKSTISGGPSTRSAVKYQTKPSKLRCPLFFVEEDYRCETLHNCIRDLIRHLKSHGFHFCSKCSQHFTLPEQLALHSCDRVARICIHLSCSNREEQQVHLHQAGCAFSFNHLDTCSKWYALHALLLPDSEQPPWEYVCVVVEDASASHGDAAASVPSDSSFRLPSLDAVPTLFNPATAPTAIDEALLYPINRADAENVASAIAHNVEVLLVGGAQQTEAIVQLRNDLDNANARNTDLQEQAERADATIADLRGQVAEMSASNAHLQGQVDSVREEMTQMRNFMLSFMRGRPQQHGNVQESPMEIDPPASEWDMVRSDEASADAHRNEGTPQDHIRTEMNAQRSKGPRRGTSERDSGYGTDYARCH